MTTQGLIPTALPAADETTFDSLIASQGASYKRLPRAILAKWLSDGYGALTPQHFGAVGDGVADDSGAIAAWVDALIAGNSIGFIPSGDYLLNTAVVRTVGAERFGFYAGGAFSARFIVPATNTTGGLIFTSTSRSGQFSAAGFSIITRGQGGTGLAYTQPEGGSQHQQAVICRDVEIKGEDGTNDWFDVFFDFAGTWRPYLENLYGSGPFIGVDNTTGSNRFAADVILNLDGSYDPTVVAPRFWGAHTLIRSAYYAAAITSFASNGSGGTRVTISNGPHPFSTGFGVTVSGAGAPYDGAWTVTNISATQFDIPVAFTSTATGTAWLTQAAEAFWLAGPFVLNGCRIGVDFRRPTREPIFHVGAGHINFRDEGLKIDGAKLVKVMGGLESYNEDAAQDYAGVPHDIFMKNVSEYVVSGASFHFSGNPTRIPVFVESDTTGEGDSGIISGNIFTCSRAYSAWLTSGVQNVKIGPNIYATAASTAEVNDVSTGNDIIDGLTETSGTWTPALTFGGAAVGLTYGARSGTYRISGGVFHAEINITLTAKGSSTGNAEISLPASLPGSLGIQTNSGAGDFAIYSAMASVSSPIARPVSATVLRLTNQAATAIANMTDANFTNTSSFTIVLTLPLY